MACTVVQLQSAGAKMISEGNNVADVIISDD